MPRSMADTEARRSPAPYPAADALTADYDVIFRREGELGAIRAGLGPFGGVNGYILRIAPPTGEKW